MPMTSSWAVQAAAGEPFAVVSVRNLSTLIQGPRDAWGRVGKTQPLLVSADVSFSSPFDTAAASDKLGADTVHYGNLSKAILASLDEFRPGGGGGGSGSSAGAASLTIPCTLRFLLNRIWQNLTGRSFVGCPPPATAAADAPPASFLSLERVRFLSVTVTLPKASLLGDGVSLTGSSVFAGAARGEEQFAVALRLNRLRVPTLIGVNDNERLAKQVIAATVTLDELYIDDDIYPSVEASVVKTLEESSFETLEALGAHLADGLLDYHKKNHRGAGWQVHIRMEKPTAVPLADCPVVEVRAGSGFPKTSKA